MTDERQPPVPDRVRAFFDSVDEPQESVEELIEEAQYEAAVRMDPSVRRVSELRLRLQGQSVVEGFYDSDVQDALAGPLGRELAAAAGNQNIEHTRLGLVGVSPGSVVLHYKPHRAVMPALQDGGVEITPADLAVRRVLRLHELFEAETNPNEIASFAGTNRALLKGAKGVVDALSKFELDLSATWWSPSGEAVRSRLTQRGRDYATGIFERQDEEERIMVQGRVCALDEDGLVYVKTPTQKYKIEVEEDDVSTFELGENVHLWVLETNHVDRVGLRGRPVHRLVRRLTGDDSPQLDLPSA